MLLTVASAASLAACATGSPEAGRPDVTPAAAEASPTGSAAKATPTPPTRPEGAYGLTLAAAEQFVRHYISLMNYAAATGDTSGMRTVSATDCDGCSKYYASVEKINEAGGGLSGDYLERVVEVTELTRTAKDKVAATTDVTVGKYTARRSRTSTPVVVQATPYTEEMVLAATGGNWQMFEMELTTR
ncbi:DUF6318 family protein [Kribbella sp. NPDC048928]|uniref:DUF6318 family protein n=1 Tax=Kribbella sp. NPDC048928 TaxID=3364111 RepID=UPI00371571AE